MSDDEIVERVATHLGHEVGRTMRGHLLFPKPAKELPPHVRQAMWKAAVSILLQNAVPDTRTDDNLMRWSA